MLHASQVPVQGESQQNPSAQLPLWHWLSPPQLSPSGFFSWHWLTEVLHQYPATQ
jgi:hypothetical protein